MKERKVNPLDIVKEYDTGDIWECPICNRRYHLLHRSVWRKGKEIKVLKHDFKELPKEDK